MSFIGYLNIAMPVVLLVMGLLASWVSYATWQRVGWTVAFIVAGAVAVFAGIRDRQQLSVENLGGDQFAAVSFLYGPGMDPRGKFPLAVSNAGDLPLYDVTIAITRQSDFFQNGEVHAIGTIYPHEILRRLEFSLPVGGYKLEIHTKAGGWFIESLSLNEEDGNVRQHYYIRRIGSPTRLMDTH